MRWTQITEGAEVTCSRCDDLIGKAKELPKGKVTCGVCGNTENNPYGYEHSRGNDQKFGRLVLTNIDVEEGTTQGTLKTAKGVSLGSLIQYGPKWHDYDGGKWEAYCMAIKKRKKGFPDQKKAVEWIVRQTRVVLKSQTESISESFETGLDESFGDHMILGNSVPVWDNVDHQDAAVFKSDTKSVEVFYRDGEYEVWNGPKMIYQTDSQESLEAKLTKYKLTKFDGVHLFSQSNEQLAERAMSRPLPKVPQWDKDQAKVLGHMVPNWTIPTENFKVAFFEGRDGNHAEVYYDGKFHVSLPEKDFESFATAGEADGHLSRNSYTDYSGWGS